ncbi:MAG: F0F1 ATP synthase subunit A [Phycisphaerales bacterium]|nr:F0F1 ATP synthase subunit A [Planctomycetota bacterium]
MMDQLLMLAAASPADHVYNHVAVKTADGWWLWSGNQGNLVLSAIILILGGLYVGSRVKTGPESEGNERFITRGKFAQLVEVICVYLRDEVARPLLGDRTDRLMPMLWTLFFFILVNNLLGLLPLLDIQHLLFPHLRDNHAAFIGGTATQNIWVTGALALIAALLFNGAALARLGLGGYIKHLTADAPMFVWPLIVPIEFLGQIFIKPVALAVRLFANMTAGHILLATLFMFVGVVWDKGILIQGPVTLISIVGGMAVMILELFVAFLQAFVFMFLTAVFISLMDHHEEHDHEHGHDHAHGHEHAHA